MTLRIRQGTTDQRVFRQVFCDGHFDFLYALEEYLPKDRDAVLLDAGANVGFATLLFAAAAQFRVRVVAVEAQPDNAAALRRNVQGLGGSVLVVGAALASAETAARRERLTFVGTAGQEWGYHLARGGNAGMATAAKPGASPQQAFHVPALSLEDLEARTPDGRFDFIKLDIEGEEHRLLVEGRSQAALCRARCIFMELHEALQPGCEAAYAYFLSHGCAVGLPAAQAAAGAGAGGFREVAVTGEYRLICQDTSADAACVGCEGGPASLPA